MTWLSFTAWDSRGSWLGAWLLLAGFGLMQDSRAADRPVCSFTAEQRAQIDARAMWGEREQVNRRKVETPGSLIEWLVAQTPLPLDEERRRVAAKIAEIRERTPPIDPPPAAAAVVERLAATLPARLRPGTDPVRLVAVDGTDQLSFSVGGGEVFVDRAFLEAALADPTSGTDRLAFVVAHELGHLAIGHARRRYQSQWLQEELKKDVELSERLKNKELMEVLIPGAGRILEHLYTREEDYQADLFAIHLCRNASFPAEACLDVIRGEAVWRDARLLEPQSPAEEQPPAERSSAVHRLRRLRLELDGRVDDDRYGLFEFDRATGELKRAVDGGLSKDARAVVCIHGMESSCEVYRPLMRQLAERKSTTASPQIFCLPISERWQLSSGRKIPATRG